MSPLATTAAVLARPGTFPWLLAHDLRLGWRGAAAMRGETGPRVMGAAVLAGAIVMHLLAWPAVMWLSPRLQASDASLAPLATVLVCTFTWMTAQALFSAARTLYARGDLDLLLGAPLPAHRVLAAKAASIAAGSFGSVALLVLPIANVGALIDRPQWLGIYPTLIAFALIATALGLALTLALFTMLGPRRARVWTHMTGAVIAGVFVLGAQVAAALPAAMRDGLITWLDALASSEGAGIATALRLPLQAARGEVVAGLVLLGMALVAFAAAAGLLGRSFASVGMAAAGAAADGAVGSGYMRPRFHGGLSHNLHRKEWRLLVRDPGMLAQLALQIIYTVPIAVVLLRSEALPPVLALAPTIVVIAAQVAASLAWITVSGEDAPELIATAPVASLEVDRAKLVAVVLPVAALLALPLAALALVSWSTALLTTVIAAAASASTALLNFWHPMPGNRRGMLRRHSQSKLIALLEHGLALSWAMVIVMALIGSTLAVAPVAIVVAVLALMRKRGARA